MYSLSLTSRIFLLFSFLVCCTGMTKWTPDCGGTLAQVITCKLEKIDCLSNETRQADRHSAANLAESVRRLNITPVFTKLVEKDPSIYIPYFCNESRWIPTLNISWLVGPSTKDTSFYVSIFYGTKHGIETLAECHQCFRLSLGKSRDDNQVVSLTSEELSQCEEGHTPVYMYVRVYNLNHKSATLEASISLPLHKNVDWYVNYGLPTHYRRIVPESCKNMSTFNPLHWTTPLYVRNSSAIKEILIQFDIIPDNEYINSYNIHLKRLNSSDELQDHFKPNSWDSFGKVLFRNITPGIYYVQFSICGNDTCYSRGHGGILQLPDDECSTNGAPAKYLPLYSGYITILDIHQTYSSSIEMHENLNSNSILAIGIGIGAAGLLILVLALILYKVRTPKDSEISRKKVLILYCKDNYLHIEVVLKFANLLLMKGECDVILDEWDTQRIHEDTIYAWLNRQIDKADKIIIVGSEGAYNVIKAQKEGQLWPELERAFIFSRIFPLVVKVLQNSVIQLREKLLSVTFDYTQMNEVKRSLREITCNPHYFRMYDELAKLLQHIHKDHKSSKNFKNKAIEMLKTDEGIQMLSSISKARQFHQSNPNWFVAQYGQPQPAYEAGQASANVTNSERLIQNHSAKQSNVYLSRNSEFDPHLSGEPLLLDPV